MRDKDDPPGLAPATGEESAYVVQRLQEERAGIAREVHDEIGGALSALNFDLAWLSRQPITPQLKARLDDAHRTLAVAMAASQSIMSRLRPPDLADGLGPALRTLALSTQRRTGVRITVTGPTPDPRIPDQVEHVAYRIAQEALTNMGKHARCQRAILAVSSTPLSFRLRIEDDGVGIEPAAEQKPGHFGLRGMRERASSVNGTLAIERRGGRGTSLLLTVPLQGAKAQPR